MSNNTKDSKSPIETLQEAAAALSREASTLAAYGSAKVILEVKAVRAAAASLQQLAEVLGWIDESLEWIAKPLQRTAAALMELTPADVAEKEVSVAGEALRAAANAVKESASPTSPTGVERVRLLPVAMPTDSSIFHSIAIALDEAATFLQADDMSRGPSGYLRTYADQLAKSQAQQEKSDTAG